MWGLQKDQVFLPNVIQGHEDLQAIRSSRSSKRGMWTLTSKQWGHFFLLTNQGYLFDVYRWLSTCVEYGICFMTLCPCFLLDQHRPQNQRSHQTKRENSLHCVLRRGPEDCLWADGERLLPSLHPVRCVQDSTPLHVKLTFVQMGPVRILTNAIE